MQLLLRRNYLVLTIEHTSREFVAVRVDGSIAHMRFAGMVDREDAPAGEPVQVLCNAWRYHSLENWRYLEDTDAIAGVIVDNQVFVILG